MSEKLCLQWNDFQENIKNAFGNLREDNDFADVTLASDDGQQVDAHKVILAASSPTFKKLLGRNKHPHPLIYLRGIKARDLVAILDFLYRGEANVFQDDLDSFLAVAEELQLKGLMGKTEDRIADFEGDEKPLPSHDYDHVDNKQLPKKIKPLDSSGNTPQASSRRQLTSKETHNSPEGNSALAIPTSYSGNFEELEARVSSLMEKSQNKTADGKKLAYLCTMCGKEGHLTNIKDHIETNHLQGVNIPCNLCEKTFRSRNALRRHNRHKCFSS